MLHVDTKKQFGSNGRTSKIAHWQLANVFLEQSFLENSLLSAMLLV